MIKYLLLILGSVVVENIAFFTTDTALELTAKNNPVLMRLLQTVDAATTDERLLDVSLQLLKSLCVCMRETLKAKQLESASFSGDTNSLQAEDTKEPSKKVLDLYQNIYIKTCIDLKHEVALKVNQSADISSDEEKDFMLRSACVKKPLHAHTNDQQNKVNGTNKDDRRLEDILYQTFIKTRNYHRFRARKYSLYKESKKKARAPAKHNIIVILTFYPSDDRSSAIINGTKLTDDLNNTLYIHSPIDIDIIDARFGQKENVSGESLMQKEATDCTLKSIYAFLLQSERHNMTKVFKLIRRSNTIKVYIDVTSGPIHSGYTKICCSNGTDSPLCKIDFSNESFDSKEITTVPSAAKSTDSFKDTISKIKSLVKMYDKKLMKKKLKYLSIQPSVNKTTVGNSSVTWDNSTTLLYIKKIETETAKTLKNPLNIVVIPTLSMNIAGSKEFWMNSIADDKPSHEKYQIYNTGTAQLISDEHKAMVPHRISTKKVDQDKKEAAMTFFNHLFTNNLPHKADTKQIMSKKYLNVQDKKYNNVELPQHETFSNNLHTTGTSGLIQPKTERINSYHTTASGILYQKQANRSRLRLMANPYISGNLNDSLLKRNKDIITTIDFPIENTFEIVVTANDKQKKLTIDELFAQPNSNGINRNSKLSSYDTTTIEDNNLRTSSNPFSKSNFFSICISLSKNPHHTENSSGHSAPNKGTANIKLSTYQRDTIVYENINKMLNSNYYMKTETATQKSNDLTTYSIYDTLDGYQFTNHDETLNESNYDLFGTLTFPELMNEGDILTFRTKYNDKIAESTAIYSNQTEPGHNLTNTKESYIIQSYVSGQTENYKNSKIDTPLKIKTNDFIEMPKALTENERRYSESLTTTTTKDFAGADFTKSATSFQLVTNLDDDKYKQTENADAITLLDAPSKAEHIKTSARNLQSSQLIRELKIKELPKLYKSSPNTFNVTINDGTDTVKFNNDFIINYNYTDEKTTSSTNKYKASRFRPDQKNHMNIAIHNTIATDASTSTDILNKNKSIISAINQMNITILNTKATDASTSTDILNKIKNIISPNSKYIEESNVITTDISQSKFEHLKLHKVRDYVTIPAHVFEKVSKYDEDRKDIRNETFKQDELNFYRTFNHLNVSKISTDRIEVPSKTKIERDSTVLYIWNPNITSEIQPILKESKETKTYLQDEKSAENSSHIIIINNSKSVPRSQEIQPDIFLSGGLTEIISDNTTAYSVDQIEDATDKTKLTSTNQVQIPGFHNTTEVLGIVSPINFSYSTVSDIKKDSDIATKLPEIFTDLSNANFANHDETQDIFNDTKPYVNENIIITTQVIPENLINPTRHDKIRDPITKVTQSIYDLKANALKDSVIDELNINSQVNVRFKNILHGDINILSDDEHLNILKPTKKGLTKTLITDTITGSENEILKHNKAFGIDSSYAPKSNLYGAHQKKIDKTYATPSSGAMIKTTNITNKLMVPPETTLNTFKFTTANVSNTNTNERDISEKLSESTTSHLNNQNEDTAVLTDNIYISTMDKKPLISTAKVDSHKYSLTENIGIISQMYEIHDNISHTTDKYPSSQSGDNTVHSNETFNILNNRTNEIPVIVAPTVYVVGGSKSEDLNNRNVLDNDPLHTTKLYPQSHNSKNKTANINNLVSNDIITNDTINKSKTSVSSENILNINSAFLSVSNAKFDEVDISKEISQSTLSYLYNKSKDSSTSVVKDNINSTNKDETTIINVAQGSIDSQNVHKYSPTHATNINTQVPDTLDSKSEQINQDLIKQSANNTDMSIENGLNILKTNNNEIAMMAFSRADMDEITPLYINSLVNKTEGINILLTTENIKNKNKENSILNKSKSVFEDIFDSNSEVITEPPKQLLDTQTVNKGLKQNISANTKYTTIYNFKTEPLNYIFAYDMNSSSTTESYAHSHDDINIPFTRSNVDVLKEETYGTVEYKSTPVSKENIISNKDRETITSAADINFESQVDAFEYSLNDAMDVNSQVYEIFHNISHTTDKYLSSQSGDNTVHSNETFNILNNRTNEIPVIVAPTVYVVGGSKPEDLNYINVLDNDPLHTTKLYPQSHNSKNKTANINNLVSNDIITNDTINKIKTSVSSENTLRLNSAFLSISNTKFDEVDISKGISQSTLSYLYNKNKDSSTSILKDNINSTNKDETTIIDVAQGSIDSQNVHKYSLTHATNINTQLADTLDSKSEQINQDLIKQSANNTDTLIENGLNILKTNNNKIAMMAVSRADIDEITPLYINSLVNKTEGINILLTTENINEYTRDKNKNKENVSLNSILNKSKSVFEDIFDSNSEVITEPSKQLLDTQTENMGLKHNISANTKYTTIDNFKTEPPNYFFAYDMNSSSTTESYAHSHDDINIPFTRSNVDVLKEGTYGTEEYKSTPVSKENIISNKDRETITSVADTSFESQVDAFEYSLNDAMDVNTQVYEIFHNISHTMDKYPSSQSEDNAVHSNETFNNLNSSTNETPVNKALTVYIVGGSKPKDLNYINVLDSDPFHTTKLYPQSHNSKNKTAKINNFVSHDIITNDTINKSKTSVSSENTLNINSLDDTMHLNSQVYEIFNNISHTTNQYVTSQSVNEIGQSTDTDFSLSTTIKDKIPVTVDDLNIETLNNLMANISTKLYSNGQTGNKNENMNRLDTSKSAIFKSDSSAQSEIDDIMLSNLKMNNNTINAPSATSLHFSQLYLSDKTKGTTVGLYRDNNYYIAQFADIVTDHGPSIATFVNKSILNTMKPLLHTDFSNTSYVYDDFEYTTEPFLHQTANIATSNTVAKSNIPVRTTANAQFNGPYDNSFKPMTQPTTAQIIDDLKVNVSKTKLIDVFDLSKFHGLAEKTTYTTESYKNTQSYTKTNEAYDLFRSDSIQSQELINTDKETTSISSPINDLILSSVVSKIKKIFRNEHMLNASTEQNQSTQPGTFEIDFKEYYELTEDLLLTTQIPLHDQKENITLVPLKNNDMYVFEINTGRTPNMSVDQTASDSIIEKLNNFDINTSYKTAPYIPSRHGNITDDTQHIVDKFNIYESDKLKMGNNSSAQSNNDTKMSNLLKTSLEIMNHTVKPSLIADINFEDYNPFTNIEHSPTHYSRDQNESTGLIEPTDRNNAPKTHSVIVYMTNMAAPVNISRLNTVTYSNTDIFDKNSDDILFTTKPYTSYSTNTNNYSSTYTNIPLMSKVSTKKTFNESVISNEFNQENELVFISKLEPTYIEATDMRSEPNELTRNMSQVTKPYIDHRYQDTLYYVKVPDINYDFSIPDVWTNSSRINYKSPTLKTTVDNMNSQNRMGFTSSMTHESRATTDKTNLVSLDLTRHHYSYLPPTVSVLSSMNYKKKEIDLKDFKFIELPTTYPHKTKTLVAEDVTEISSGIKLYSIDVNKNNTDTKQAEIAVDAYNFPETNTLRSGTYRDSVVFKVKKSTKNDIDANNAFTVRYKVQLIFAENNKKSHSRNNHYTSKGNYTPNMATGHSPSMTTSVPRMRSDLIVNDNIFNNTEVYSTNTINYNSSNINSHSKISGNSQSMITSTPRPNDDLIVSKIFANAYDNITDNDILYSIINDKSFNLSRNNIFAYTKSPNQEEDKMDELKIAHGIKLPGKDSAISTQFLNQITRIVLPYQYTPPEKTTFTTQALDEYRTKTFPFKTDEKTSITVNSKENNNVNTNDKINTNMNMNMPFNQILNEYFIEPAVTKVNLGSDNENEIESDDNIMITTPLNITVFKGNVATDSSTTKKYVDQFNFLKYTAINITSSRPTTSLSQNPWYTLSTIQTMLDKTTKTSYNTKEHQSTETKYGINTVVVPLLVESSILKEQPQMSDSGPKSITRQTFDSAHSVDKTPIVAHNMTEITKPFNYMLPKVKTLMTTKFDHTTDKIRIENSSKVSRPQDNLPSAIYDEFTTSNAHNLSEFKITYGRIGEELTTSAVSSSFKGFDTSSQLFKVDYLHDKSYPRVTNVLVRMIYPETNTKNIKVVPNLHSKKLRINVSQPPDTTDTLLINDTTEPNTTKYFYVNATTNQNTFEPSFVHINNTRYTPDMITDHNKNITVVNDNVNETVNNINFITGNVPLIQSSYKELDNKQYNEIPDKTTNSEQETGLPYITSTSNKLNSDKFGDRRLHDFQYENVGTLFNSIVIRESTKNFIQELANSIPMKGNNFGNKQTNHDDDQMFKKTVFFINRTKNHSIADNPLGKVKAGVVFNPKFNKNLKDISNNASFNLVNGTEKAFITYFITHPIDIANSRRSFTIKPKYVESLTESSDQKAGKHTLIIPNVTNEPNFKSSKSIVYNTYKTLTEEELTLPPDVRKIITTFSTIYTKEINNNNQLAKSNAKKARIKQRKEEIKTNYKSKSFKKIIKPKLFNKNVSADAFIDDTLKVYRRTYLPMPIEKLPMETQWTSFNRIKLKNRKNAIMTMKTDDFFSFRRAATKKGPVKPNFKSMPKLVKVPKATKMSRLRILRPKFNSFEDLKKNPVVHPVVPNQVIMPNDIDFYFNRAPFQTHHKPIQFWKEKIDDVRTILKPQRRSDTKRQEPRKVFEPVIDVPYYMPTLMKPSFLRDRVESVRSYIYNEGKNPVNTRKHFRNPPRVEETSGVLVETTDSQEHVYLSAGASREVTDYWLDDMYLKVRLPLPINSNPGMVFPRRRFAKVDEVADLAALFIDDLLDYKEMLDRGELPLERATSREKGQPLCMEQFYKLLGVCRVPQLGRDRLELPPLRPEGEQEELVVVACRNYFYPIPVKAADRGRLTPGEIQAQLLMAMVEAAGAPAAPRVGLLSSLPRDAWARARDILCEEETNRHNMELISRALCIVCLDETGGDRADADADTNALLRAMHGAGTKYHSANRWFDKTVQLIISSDGTVGMCYEHSAAEGVAVVRLAERALARAAVAARPAPPPALLPAPQAMRWILTTDVERMIDQAGREIDRNIADLDLKVYTYRGYGREFMKSCRTSPDVYIQLAMQYAYYKMYGNLVSTYESASLRRFLQGRVDNIRSAHLPAQAWAKAMCADETPPLSEAEDSQKKVSFNLYGDQKKLELFEEAAKKQTAIMEANIQGRGIDNHLLGLRETARAQGPLLELFTDPTYKQMNEFKLSTSQVATTTDGTFMGYGAVVPDGYGCSYNPKKDCVIFCIGSFASSSVTNTEAFRQSLEEALDSMKLMFQHRQTE